MHVLLFPACDGGSKTLLRNEVQAKHGNELDLHVVSHELVLHVRDSELLV